MKSNFGDYLRKLRHDRQLTLFEAGEKAEISITYLSQLERGERGLPTIKTLVRLAEAYGIHADALTEEAFKNITTKGFTETSAIERKKAGHSTTLPAVTADFILTTYAHLPPDKQRLFQDYLLFLVGQDKAKK
jgi:transcriptional regulator with XRE-family HTH domain